MAFPETFHGPFVVIVTHVDSPRVQELVVTGSDGSDGRYPGKVGESFQVDGETWTLGLEWYQPKGGWRSSYVRNDPAYTVQDGLVYTLRAVNGQPVAPIQWKNLWVAVTPTDPALNPMYPPDSPPDFTIPKPR